MPLFFSRVFLLALTLLILQRGNCQSAGSGDYEAFVDYGDEEIDNYCRDHGMKAASESSLFKQLTTSGYSSNFRPRKDATETVQVNVSFVLQAVSDFDIQANKLTIKGMLSLTWFDDYLRWNTSMCLETITAPASTIWTPDLAITNSPDGIAKAYFTPSLYKAKMDRRGSIEYYPTGEFSVKCELNLVYFPFDEQICSIRLQSINYDTEQMSIRFDPKVNPVFQMDTAHWVDHPLWQVLELRALSTVKKDTKKNFDLLVFEMLLARKPLYYYMNVVTPGIIIATIVMVVFALAVDSVGKFGFGFTCLLAYTVFNNMVMGEIPKSSLQVPVISIYIYLQMAYIAVIILAGQSLILLICYRGNIKDSKPPPWLIKLLCINCSVNIVNKDNKVFVVAPAAKQDAEKTKDGEKPKSAKEEAEDAKEDTKSAKSAKKDAIEQVEDDKKDVEQPKDEKKPAGDEKMEKKDEKPSEDGKMQWMAVARVVSRITMVIYIFLIVITPCIMFRLVPKHLSLAEANRQY